MLTKFTLLTAAVVALALDAPAGVMITRLDPAIDINAFSDITGGRAFNVFANDFNADGDVDFILASGLGSIVAFFDTPTRFAAKVPATIQPGVTNIVGPVGAVPFGSTIGSNILSSVATNYFLWSGGITNRDDLTQPFGNHFADVISAGVVPFSLSGTSAGGIFFTNVNPPTLPVVVGDVPGKEGVMAVEFYINGQPHYGYIQFDFRIAGGFVSTGGLIRGWAYESEPGKPIMAMPLNEPMDDDDHHRPDQGSDHHRR